MQLDPTAPRPAPKHFSFEDTTMGPGFFRDHRGELDLAAGTGTTYEGRGLATGSDERPKVYFEDVATPMAATDDARRAIAALAQVVQRTGITDFAVERNVFGSVRSIRTFDTVRWSRGDGAMPVAYRDLLDAVQALRDAA